MPPLHQGHPNSNGPSAFEIASTNAAINTFLGTRQPAWLPGGSNSPRTRLPALSSNGSSNRDLPSAHQPQEQSNHNVTNNGLPAERTKNTQNVSRCLTTVLPSPTPTNETSPVISLSSGSPLTTSRRVTENAGSSRNGTTRHAYFTSTDSPTLLHRPSCPSATVNEGLSHGPPPVSTPVAVSCGLPTLVGNTLNTPSVLSSGQVGTGQYPEVAESEGSLRRESSILRNGSKRSAPSSNSPGMSSKRAHSAPGAANVAWISTSTLTDTIRAQMASWPCLGDSSNEPLRHRYDTLLGAAGEEDWWFLVFHCIFFQSRTLAVSFYEELRESRFGPEIMQIANSLELLASLMPSHASLDSQHLQWFASFPAADLRRLQLCAPSSAVNSVFAYLSTFAAQWPSAITKTRRRGYPLLVHELHQMHCVSPRMQASLTSYVLGALSASGAVQEIWRELDKDRAFEKLVQGGTIPDMMRTQARIRTADLFKAIVRNYQQPAQVTDAQQALHATPSDAEHTESVLRGQRQTSAEGNVSPPVQQLLSPPPHNHEPSQLHADRIGTQMEGETTGQQNLHPEGFQANQRVHQLMDPQYRQPWAHQLLHYSPSQPSRQVPAAQRPPRAQPQRLIPERQPDHRFVPSAHQAQAQQGLPNGNRASGPTILPGIASLPHPLTSQHAREGRHMEPIHPLSSAPETLSSSLPALRSRYSQAVQNSRARAAPISASLLSRVHSPSSRQNTRVGPSFGVPVRTIPPTEYPDNTWNWTSLEPGMHMVRQRSPIREPLVPTNTRYYQYVSEYVATKVLMPRVGLERIEFDIDPDVKRSLVCMQSRHGLERCQHGDGSRRVRLRLCKYPESAADFEMSGASVAASHWPENIYISCNGSPMQLRRKQHFRTDLPAELTGLVRSGHNSIVVSLPELPKPRQDTQKYLMMVELVTVSSAVTLRGHIISSTHFSSEQTRGVLRQRLIGSASADDDVVIQDKHLSISVADPFSSTLCMTPIRSILCKHVECFDLENWLQSRPSKPSKRAGEPSRVDDWKCPICGGDARPHQLRIDDFFVEVKDKLLADGAERTKMIKIDDQGDWSAIIEADDSEDEDQAGVPTIPIRNPQTSRRGSRTTPAVIVLDDDD